MTAWFVARYKWTNRDNTIRRSAESADLALYDGKRSVSSDLYENIVLAMRHFDSRSFVLVIHPELTLEA